MFKIHNIIVILGLLVGASTTSAALKQSLNNPTIPSQPAISKTVEMQRININTADVAALLKIKGFGKKKAEAIIEYRNKNGIFKSLEEVLKIKVRGLNQKWLDKVSQFLTI